MKKYLLLLLVCISSIVYTQNIAVTDDDSYTPDNSAMLDVMSTTKGMLVPRVTADQRITILNPADGLLVFDTDSVSFYFYSGSAWVNLTSANPSNIWAKNSGNVFLSDTTYKLGVGTNSPTGKFIVQADNSIGVEDPLFEVKDKDGQTVFAVHNDGIRVYVDESAKGNIGGFAVSGRSVTKGIKDYMWITKDSIRMYLDDSGKGNIGGFAVSGRSVTKGSYDEYLRVTPDSTRVWVKKGAKGNIGGFAVSGRSVTKGIEEPIFVSTFDSTRVYVDQSAKGNIGGFAVSGRETTKGNVTNFMDLTPENYFIGHESGINTIPISSTSGKFNTFFGYRCGVENIDGYQNLFSGYEAGLSNISGRKNVYLGYQAGYSNTNGSLNVFIGSDVGKYTDTSAHDNVYIGFAAARDKPSGSANVVIGKAAGQKTGVGNRNVIIGNYAGVCPNYSQNNEALDMNVIIGSRAAYNGIGIENVVLGAYAGYSLDTVNSTRNVIIGPYAGYSEKGSNKLYISNSTGGSTSALVYGEFDAPMLRINGTLNIRNNYNLPDSDGLASQIITTDGSGNLTWGYGATQASNGLTLTNNDVEWGGSLSKVTTIAQAGYDIRFDMTGAGDFEVHDNGVLAFKVNDNGNVAVGNITTPTERLEVAGDIVAGSATAYDGSSEHIQIIGRSDSWYLGVRNESDVAGSDFFIGQGDLEDGIFHIKNNGNIGVGTYSPDAKLDVNGMIRATSLPAWPTSGEGLEIGYNSGSNIGYIQSYDRDTDSWAQIRMGGNIFPVNNNSFYFGASGLAWYRVYSYGYVTQTKSFKNRKLLEEILNYPPQAKKDNSDELDGASLPIELKDDDNWVIIDEMASYNYQLNYEQQVLINQLQEKLNEVSKQLESLAKENQELKTLIENK